MSELDQRVRLAAFTFLDRQTRLHGETLPRDVLATASHVKAGAYRRVPPQGGDPEDLHRQSQ